jgi:hypothetical protein
VSQLGRREARLKAEFARLYPPVEAGHWEPAGVIADRVLTWLLHAHSGHVSVGRVLKKEHFEFRGISARPSNQRNRTRREDGPPLSSSVPGRPAQAASSPT